MNLTGLAKGLWLVLSLASLAMAADPDPRLIDAIDQQDKQAVRALLKAGVDVNATRADGTTALIWATHRDDLDTVDLLMRAGAIVNAADEHGVTPLMLACENGSASVVEKLLKAGANANAAQAGGLTSLLIAAQSGNVNVVKQLLVHGADVRAATVASKQTALMWALAEGHLDIVQVLINAGADVHAQTRDGFTPMLFAARNGDIAAARILLSAGVSVNETGSDGTHPLPLAIVSGHEAFALFLLEQGADANGTVAGTSALHSAVGNVSAWLSVWLRARGGAGLPALAPAVRLRLVRALLARGANPNARITASTQEDKPTFLRIGAFEPSALGIGELRGATPLWIAAFFYDPEMMRVLLAAGADPGLRTDDLTTPLMTASGLGKNVKFNALSGTELQRALESMALLVEAGADVNAVNEAGFTALHGAVSTGATEPVQYLVDHGADMNKQDFKGRTPFRRAEGATQDFRFIEWPKTAALLRKLGADTTLGIPGRIQEQQLQRVTGQ